MGDVIELRDVAKACGCHGTRVSEALTGLGAGMGRTGRRGGTMTLATAIRVGVSRRLVDLGMNSADAIECARQITDQDLAEMIADDRPCWLAAGIDPDNPEGFIVALFGPHETAELVEHIAAGVRVVPVHLIAGEIMNAVHERKRAEASREACRVTSYTSTDRQMNGIVLEGLALAVVERGRGKRIQLSVEQARELAERLLAAAAALDIPERLN